MAAVHAVLLHAHRRASAGDEAPRHGYCVMCAVRCLLWLLGCWLRRGVVMWLGGVGDGGHPDAVRRARQARHIDGDGAVRVMLGTEVEGEALVQRNHRDHGLEDCQPVSA